MTEELSKEAKSLADNLTDVQLAFALHILEGKTQADAYRLTHEGCADVTAYTKGSGMVRIGKVRDFIRQVREDGWREEWVGIGETRAILAEMIRDGSRMDKDRLSAMAQNAKLAGFDQEETGAGLEEFARWLMQNNRPLEPVQNPPEIDYSE